MLVISQQRFGGHSININYAQRPLSSYEEYLNNCASKFKPAECGKQIYFGIFIGNPTINDYCCHSLVNEVGKSCHVDMASYAIQFPVFAKNKTEILGRCGKIWNDCNAIHRILP